MTGNGRKRKLQDSEICKSSSGNDFLKGLFLSGLHSTLETILRNFPIETVRICKTVSSEWSEMIGFFVDSKIPRVKDIFDNKLSFQWKKKKSVIERKVFEVGIDFLDYDHMIADETNICLSAMLIRPRIFIFDSKNSTLTQTLDLEAINRGPVFEGENTEIKLAMNKFSLVAYVCLEDGRKSGKGLCFIWKRNNSNFILDQICSVRKEGFHLRGGVVTEGPLVKNVPVIQREKVLVPVLTGNAKADYIIKIEPLKDFETDAPVRVSGPFQKSMSDIVDRRKYVFANTGSCWLNQRLTFYEKAKTKFSKVYKQRSGIMIGIDSQYIVVLWWTFKKPTVKPAFKGNTILEVYDVDNGDLKFSLEAEAVNIRSGMSKNPAAQICGGRMAFFGTLLGKSEMELNVFDLKSGELILNCSEDLKIPGGKNFVLERDRILVAHEGKMHSAKF